MTHRPFRIVADLAFRVVVGFVGMAAITGGIGGYAWLWYRRAQAERAGRRPEIRFPFHTPGPLTPSERILADTRRILDREASRIYGKRR